MKKSFRRMIAGGIALVLVFTWIPGEGRGAHDVYAAEETGSENIATENINPKVTGTETADPEEAGMPGGQEPDIMEIADKQERECTFSFPEVLYVGDDPKKLSEVVWDDPMAQTEPVFYYTSSDNPDSSVSSDLPEVLGNYFVYAIFPETDDYQSYISEAAMFELKKLPVPEVPYTVEETAGTNGWYQSAVTLHAPEGYKISAGESEDYCESLTVEETKSFNLYLMRDSGAKTDAVPVSLQIDKTAPAFDGPEDGITIEGQNWKTFSENITYEYFWNTKKTVTIKAQDPESGIAKCEYLISHHVRQLWELEGESAWTQGDTFEISSDCGQNNIIYARITNGAGMVSYLSTAGIVYDKQAPVIWGAADQDVIYAQEKELIVYDDHLDRILVNGEEQPEPFWGRHLLLSAKESPEYTIEAWDKSGNKTSIKLVFEESWVKGGIADGEKKKLKKGVPYRFGGDAEGRGWQVKGDSTVYRDNITFYVTKERVFEFKLK